MLVPFRETVLETVPENQKKNMENLEKRVGDGVKQTLDHVKDK